MTDTADRRRLLGPFSVAPIGFGAMRLAGPNVFGPPNDRRQAISVLREAVDRGVDHIDTAQFYGPDVVNELIRDALHPYPPQLVIVSKVGASRDSRGGIFAADAPDQLRSGIEDNLRTLRIETLPVVNLRLMRRTGPDAFFDDQLAAMIGQNRQAAFQQAKADQDYGDVNRLLTENTDLTRVIHQLTQEVHERVFASGGPHAGDA